MVKSMYKKFNGNKFKLDEYHNSKQVVQMWAAAERRKGNFARVTKGKYPGENKKSYLLWVSKK